MDQFIQDYTVFREGFPLVTVRVDDSIGKVQFSQRHNMYMYVGISKEIRAYLAVVPLIQPIVLNNGYTPAPTQHELGFLAQFGFK